MINVEDELNAYTVFETLNARGMELSSTDLLKNYLFSRVKAKSDLAALQRRWRSLIETVRQERFPEFLRYHLLCSEPQIRSARLFKIVRDRVKQPQDVFDLMESLDQRAELFLALTDDTTFERKTDAYTASRYAMTRQIAIDAPTEWTPQQVEKRQRWLADRATHLWRSDFA